MDEKNSITQERSRRKQHKIWKIINENNTKRGVIWKETAITGKLSTKSAQNMKVTDQISAKGENFWTEITCTVKIYITISPMEKKKRPEYLVFGRKVAQNSKIMEKKTIKIV